MVVRLILLVIIFVISALALVALLPWIKEGYDLGDLARFATVTAGLAIVVWIWWRFERGVPRALGLAVLLLPLFIYGSLSAKLIFNFWKGRQISRETKIVSFRATPIEWPGFSGPVGLRVALEISHPTGLDVTLLPPKIAMTNLAELDASHYFSFLSEFQRAYLSVPLFPIGREMPRSVFRDSPSRIEYELYPSTIHRLDHPRHVCFWKDPPKPNYADGSNYSASWYLITRGGANVDLSRQLTASLRTAGAPDVADWIAMMRRVEPAGLLQAGFAACPDTSGDVCYCAN